MNGIRREEKRGNGYRFFFDFTSDLLCYIRLLIGSRAARTFWRPPWGQVKEIPPTPERTDTLDSMVQNLEQGFDHPENHGQNAPPEPTTRELLQQIIQLRQENEIIRQRADDAHQRAEEANVENQAARREVAEARRQLEETIRGQDAFQRANGDFLRRVQVREEQERGRRTELVMPEEGYPLSAGVMAEVVPQHFIVPKIPSFTGNSDPEVHLKAFNAQMLVSGGSDAVRCKVFVGTLSGTALKWFGSLPRSSISSFAVFARTFVERFAANRSKIPKMADLFDVRQNSDETLRDYLNRFCDACTNISSPNEEILVDAFVKGLRANTFSESLVRIPALSLSEIRSRATTHIEAEDVMRQKRHQEKRMNGDDKARDTRRTHNVPFLKRTDKRFSPYVASTSLSRPGRGTGAKRSTTRTGVHAEALANKDITKDLKWPDPTNRILGRDIKEWCEFHRTYGHHTERCVTLANQLQRLRGENLGGKPTQGGTQPKEKSDHVSPIFADLNTIAGGFSGGGPTSASRKRYARSSVMTTSFASRNSTPTISFSEEDRADIVPHEDDPVVVSVIAMGRWVHRVLVDQGSSADVLFWDAFVGLGIPTDQLRPFDGVLVGFAGDAVEVRGYTDLKTTFSDGEAAKTITVRYIVVRAPSSYNILLGRPSLNRLEAVVSTAHLKVKFPTEEGRIATLRVDQTVARKCYENSLKVRRSMYALSLCGSQGENLPDFDPRVGVEDKRPQPIGEIEEISLGGSKKVKVGGGLDSSVRAELIGVLQKHSSSFAWCMEDMVGIDPSVITHRLNVDPNAKARVQRRRKMAPEKVAAVREETKKLLSAGHIREIQYPEWLANVVMVCKPNGKWRMCVDFSDLNSACPKDSYPLPNIDMLVDDASGCGLLSFMDAYSGYNQIGMHSEDEEKTTFMGEAATYCYKVMPFGLKNAGATYQRLMDRILKPIPKHRVQAYVDDMVVASTTAGAHTADLEELFITINKYGLKLNPDKCVFGVKAGKFLGFLLTERGIEANPDKCSAILNMRSPTNVKEVQRLTGRIAALSRFLPRAGDHGHPYFECLRKGKGFQWSDECEKAFQRLKEQLSCPPILCRPILGKPLKLYVTVTDRAISVALMQDQEKEQRPIYFVSKTLRGVEARYQKIEKVALAVVFSTRRLRHYFQAHSVSVMTDQPIKQILQKPEVSGRLAKWAIELSEYDVSFEPRGPIKAQVLSDFLAELTPPPSQQEEVKASWILSVDGATNSKGSGAGIILEDPQGALIEQSLHFAFRASNNQAEYEALIAGMLLAKELGIQNLLAKSDSLLVTGQVSGEYQAKDPLLSRYLDFVHTLASHFHFFKLMHVPREQNSRADLLSKLASFSRPGRQRSVIRETLVAPRVSEVESDVQICALGIMTNSQERPSSWMTPYIVYLADGHLPKVICCQTYRPQPTEHVRETIATDYTPQRQVKFPNTA